MLLPNVLFVLRKSRLLLIFVKNQELSCDYLKMNKIICKFLLTGDKFIPELHLK